MAKTLFISTNDIKVLSNFSGNIDDNKMIQFISIAQDLDLEPVLGTKLYKRVYVEITNNNITPEIQLLLEKYIKPTLIHFAQARILPNIAYSVSNGGLFKHNSENSETVNIEELNVLTTQEESISGQYAERMANFLQFHTSEYPEYVSNINEDIRPDREPIYNSWELNGNRENVRKIGGFYHRNK